MTTSVKKVAFQSKGGRRVSRKIMAELDHKMLEQLKIHDDVITN